MNSFFEQFFKKTGDSQFPIRPLGVYKIVPTLESIVKAAHYHQYTWLLGEDGNYQDEIDWASLKNIALIELQVIGLFNCNDLMEVFQDDQAPYMEFYLDSEGRKTLTETEVEQTVNCRICFFFHFLKTKKPLMIKGQPYKLPAMSTLPERLIPFTHYLPVD